MDYVDGSPPRAWGQRRGGESADPPARFTPTGVGTTINEKSAALKMTVHPHGRGDNTSWIGHVDYVDGSPPRAWGQRNRRTRLPARFRFTPTGVGTTAAPPGTLRFSTVHPHGRGDNMGVSGRAFRVFGSPPRAWGQRTWITSITGRLRFTPTGVGTTMALLTLSRRLPVHPHGRGDNSNTWQSGVLPNGSPPRAWGQL